MTKERWINWGGKWIRPNWWQYFLWQVRLFIITHKYKFINTYKYKIIPNNDYYKYYYILSEKEYKQAEEIYRIKGTISYEFYPTGIGWGVKIHVKKTGEIIDITDVSNW